MWLKGETMLYTIATIIGLIILAPIAVLAGLVLLWLAIMVLFSPLIAIYYLWNRVTKGNWVID